MLPRRRLCRICVAHAHVSDHRRFCASSDVVARSSLSVLRVLLCLKLTARGSMMHPSHVRPKTPRTAGSRCSSTSTLQPVIAATQLMERCYRQFQRSAREARSLGVEAWRLGYVCVGQQGTVSLSCSPLLRVEHILILHLKVRSQVELWVKSFHFLQNQCPSKHTPDRHVAAEAYTTWAFMRDGGTRFARARPMSAAPESRAKTCIGLDDSCMQAAPTDAIEDDRLAWAAGG